MRKIWFAILFGCSVSLSSLAGVNEGIRAYNRGDFATSFREWQTLAKKGDARAQFYLAYLYEHGNGVRRDHDKALMWYTLSAEQGNVEALYALAVKHASGLDVPKNKAKAAELSHLAATAGNRTEKPDLANTSTSANTPSTKLTGLNEACAGCHRAGINGAPKIGDKEAWAPLLAQGPATLYKNLLQGTPTMAPKCGATELSDAEVKRALDLLIQAAQ